MGESKLLKMDGSRLQRIANVLLLDASFTGNIGLLDGKMGIAIFFYQYYRYTGNKVYEDCAGELIDEIFAEIRAGTPVGFPNGLMGIGWGIEYLVYNNSKLFEKGEVMGAPSVFVNGYPVLPTYMLDDLRYHITALGNMRTILNETEE